MNIDPKVDLSRYVSRQIDIQRKFGSYIPDGVDNLFPNYLDGLYNAAPTHRAVVNSLVRYIIGKGLISDNLADEGLIKKHFDKHTLKKIEKYRKLHNAVCIVVVRDALLRVNRLKVLNPSQVRVSQCNQKGEPTVFEYRRTWDKGVQSYYSNKGILIPTYDTSSKESLLYWYDSGTYDVPYGRPEYLSGLNAIEFEASLYLGDNHGAQNGMTPSAIITLPDSGNEESNKKAQKAIQENLSGVAQSGKHATVFAKAGETTPPTVTLLNDNRRESKKTNYEVAEIGILKSWEVPTPTLISGLNTKSTGFGNAEEEMQWGLNTWKSTQIDPDQEDLLDILNPVIREVGIVGDLTFEPLQDRNIAVQEGVVEENAPVNENLKNLTGRQLQNIERVARKFKKGQLTKGQASRMLKGGYNLTDEDISEWLKDFEVKMSKVLTLEMIIDESESYESLLNDGWEVDKVENAAGNAIEEKLLTSERVELASTGTAIPNATTSQSGEKGDVSYKILYQYSGNPSPQREFCQKMMSANKLYRYEDIVRMGSVAVNSGFGVNGASTYDIFKYKGGPNCKHYWERVTFVKKGTGNVDARNPNAKKLTESQADERRMTPTGQAKVDQKISETAPFNMPNRGYKLSNYIKKLWQPI